MCARVRVYAHSTPLPVSQVSESPVTSAAGSEVAAAAPAPADDPDVQVVCVCVRVRVYAHSTPLPVSQMSESPVTSAAGSDVAAAAPAPADDPNVQVVCVRARACVCVLTPCTPRLSDDRDARDERGRAPGLQPHARRRP